MKNPRDSETARDFADFADFDFLEISVLLSKLNTVGLGADAAQEGGQAAVTGHSFLNPSGHRRDCRRSKSMFIRYIDYDYNELLYAHVRLYMLSLVKLYVK